MGDLVKILTGIHGVTRPGPLPGAQVAGHKPSSIRGRLHMSL